MARLKDRLALVLSITALLVALFGATPAGNAVTRVLFAQNADKVDGIHASRTPARGKLLPLNSSKKFPASAIPSLSLAAVGQLNDATCEGFGQTGSLVVDPDPDPVNVEMYLRLNCKGVIPPDRFEPNDDAGPTGEDLPTGLGFGTTSASIVPVGDIDVYLISTHDFCPLPEWCEQGFLVTLQSENPNVRFDALNQGQPPLVWGTPTETDLVEWHTGEIKQGDLLLVWVHSPGIAKYTLTVALDNP